MITRKSKVRHDPVRSVALAVVAIGSVSLVFACADARNAPTEPIKPGGGSFAAGPGDPVTPGVVTLCKVGVEGAFNVQVGTNAPVTPMTMAGNTCHDIASVPPTQRDDVIVTITENTGASYALDHILVRQGQAADRTVTGQRTISLEAAHGAIVTYYNNAVVTLCEHGAAVGFEYQVGQNDATHTVALENGQCSPIGTIPYAQADDVIVTVHDLPSSAYSLDHSELTIGLTQGTQSMGGHHWVSFEGVHGAVLEFFHVASTSAAQH
jgi:hypothetical protein